MDVEREQSVHENAPASASQANRIAPSLLAHALAELSQSMDLSSPGPVTRMTAGDFVASVVGVLRLVGEVPRRFRPTPIGAQATCASYAQAVRAGLAAPRPRTASQPKRAASTSPRTAESKAIEQRRRQVLNAALNTFRRTKNPDARSLYTKYIPGGAKQMREHVRKMTPEQLKNMPKELSALFGCGLIPRKEQISDWVDEMDVELIEERFKPRQRGEAKKAQVPVAAKRKRT